MKPPAQRGLKFNKTVLVHTNAAVAVPVAPANSLSMQLSTPLILPLATDVVQYAAIAAATQGQSLLLYGAAGTGKSQTISNTIAQCFALGKRVLFVADDPAALEVVYQQLQTLELENLCLPLYQCRHSTHLSQMLIDRVQQRVQQDTPEQIYRQNQFDDLSHQIQQIRQQWAQYQQALHCVQPMGWSVYQALAAQIGQYDQPRFSLPELAVTTRDAAGLATCLNVAHEVSVLIQPVLPVLQHPLAGFVCAVDTTWSADWQQQQVADLQAWQPLLVAMQQQLDQQFYTLGLRRAKNWHELSQQLTLITQLYQMQQQFDPSIFQHLQQIKSADQLQRMVEAATAARQIQQRQQQLNATYHSDIYDHIKILQEDFQHAVTQFWPWSSWQLLHVRGRVAGYSVQAKRLSRDQIWHDLQMLAEIKVEIQAFDALAKDAERLLINDWAGLATDWTWVERLSEAWHGLEYLADRLGLDATALPRQLQQISPQQQQQVQTDRQALQQLWQRLGDDVLLENPHYSRPEQPFNLIKQRIQRLLAHQQVWRVWYDYQTIRQRASQLGLKPALDALEQGGLLPAQFRKTVLLNIQQDWLLAQVTATPVLAAFDRQHYSNMLLQEQGLLKQQHYAAKQLIQQRQRLAPQMRQSLQQQIDSLCNQSCDDYSIEVLLEKNQPVWSALTPCVMANSAVFSADSVASFNCLELFDLVVVDMATQPNSVLAAAVRQRMTTLMLVADQAINTHSSTQYTAVKFNKKIQDQPLEQDLIADLPQYLLRWHYRSRSERLFVFSNQYYYSQHIYSFPMLQRQDHSVQLDVIEHGSPEHLLALAIDHVVRLIQQKLAEQPSKPADQVVILVWNPKQQQLLAAGLQAKLAEWPEYLAQVTIRPMTQISSQAYDQVVLLIAPSVDDFNQVSAQQFNVALTRARHHLHVVSTIRAQQLRPSVADPAILQDLKAFLADAEQQCQPSQPLSRDTPPWDAPLEQYIYHALIMRGWDVHTEWGASGYPIDLAVVDPDHAERYLLAIFCDGHHRLNRMSAVDEQQRFTILQQRGWRIYHVWPLDWWHDPHAEIERLQAILLEQQAQNFQHLS